MNNKNLSFLIILAYYKRPIIVKNALLGIKNLTYQNWELVFLDDSGDSSYESELLNFGLDNSKVKYIAINQSDDEKAKQGGSRHGEYMNNIITNSQSDIVVILCDDDILKEDYLDKLNDFYLHNPNVKYSYSHLEFYDPSVGPPSKNNVVSNKYTTYLNSATHPIRPAGNVDSSQVSWRKNNWIEDGIQFDYPRTSHLDEMVYRKMYSAWGDCQFNGIISQWKGIHGEQLVNLSIKKKL